MRAVVLERTGEVGASWRRHYDRLHLHTTRRWSSLPGLAMPRRFGRWVSRADMVRYLEKYADHHELEVVTGVEVSRMERAGDGTGWRLSATGGRVLTGRAVVVATGFNHTPRVPDWPGREGFTGTLLHAAEYREPGPYAGKDVLVAGIGNTGAEIAVDLVEGRCRPGADRGPHASAHRAPLDGGLARAGDRRPGPPAAGPAGRRGGAADVPDLRTRPLGARAAPAARGASTPGSARARSRSRTSG
ncbi:hypothetical protein GCM10020227_42750 [Streptomyces flavovirens]